MKPMSRRALTALDASIVLAPIVAVTWGRSNMPAWLLGAVLLLALRVTHGLRFPRSMGQLEGEDLSRARVESGREWLPVLDEDRANLNPFQVQLLDGLGGLLTRLANPRLQPSTCLWWRSEEELRVYLPIAGTGAAGLKSGYIFLPTYLRMAYFVEYGVIDSGDAYDFEFGIGSNRPDQVALDSMNALSEIARALRWLESLISGPTSTGDELDQRL